jgi:hypothetical protein
MPLKMNDINVFFILILINIDQKSKLDMQLHITLYSFMQL